ncbi:MAG: hypothetical protein HQ475_14760 [SAR202 cluster bacterium]|nr:hypothetical protein [SAR202 cluster bacterium]
MLSFTRQLQSIVILYRSDGKSWPATSRELAAWAIANGHWQARRSDLISQCADQISRALREEYITDPQGRRVRTKHPARIEKEGEQLVLWDDIRTASRGHMSIAFQQRRQQIVGDCNQLKSDVDSFNDNRNSLDPIQMRFDFTMDLQELAAAY